MKKHLKKMMVALLVAPCLMFMTACGNDIGKKLSDDDAKEALIKIGTAMGTFETDMLGWEGVNAKLRADMKGSVKDQFQTQRMNMKFGIDAKIGLADEFEDMTAAIKITMSAKVNVFGMDVSLSTKSNYYVADETVYDNRLKTQADADEEDVFMPVILAEIFGLGGVSLNFDEVKSVHSKDLKNDKVQYTVTLDLKEVYADEDADSVKTKGRSRFTFVLDGDDKIVELKASSNYTVTTTFKDEDGNKTVETDKTKVSLSIKEFTGTVKAPKGFAKYEEGPVNTLGFFGFLEEIL
jgi:hypothetical protein